MDTVTWVQILDDSICILYGANNTGEGINATIVHPARADWVL